MPSKSVPARTFLALVTFAFLICTALWVINKKHPIPRPGSSEPSAKEKLAEIVFYRTIGNAPRANDADPDSIEKSEEREDQYTLEIAVVHQQSEAEQRVQALEARGVAAYYSPFKDSQGQVVYRIRSGVYRDRDIALRAKDGIGLDAKVVLLR